MFQVKTHMLGEWLTFGRHTMVGFALSGSGTMTFFLPPVRKRPTLENSVIQFLLFLCKALKTISAGLHSIMWTMFTFCELCLKLKHSQLYVVRNACPLLIELVPTTLTVGATDQCFASQVSSSEHSK